MNYKGLTSCTRNLACVVFICFAVCSCDSPQRVIVICDNDALSRIEKEYDICEGTVPINLPMLYWQESYSTRAGTFTDAYFNGLYDSVKCSNFLNQSGVYMGMTRGREPGPYQMSSFLDRCRKDRIYVMSVSTSKYYDVVVAYKDYWKMCVLLGDTNTFVKVSIKVPRGDE